MVAEARGAAAGRDAALPEDVRACLVAAGLGPVTDISGLARVIYSSDASLYRVAPQAVVSPRDADDVEALVDVCRRTGVPLTPRGAGTSCAGNAVGPGIVADLRALNTISELDVEGREISVGPGVVQADLQRHLAPHGLRFGPDPSTSSRCTVGGMIGNNACGPRALGYGTTAAAIVSARLVLGNGQAVGTAEREWAPAIGLVRAHADAVARECGRFSRQVSGYGLQHLAAGDVGRFLAGTEGTLGVLTEARVRLAAAPRTTALVALGYPDIADAGDAVAGLLGYGATAIEGFDDRIIDVVRNRKGPAAVPDLPRGRGFLLVELGGDDPSELLSRGAEIVAAAGALEGRVLPAGPEASALWQIRADGAGLAAVGLGRLGHAGWEDAAVPPERLGPYLRDYRELLDAHGLDCLPYGHFGEGCVHGRVDFPLARADGARRYRDFIWDAARLVATYGGSMSGEHGDGRARSELLGLMYSPEILELFAALKGLCDPDAICNPGVLVDPRPLDADLRLAISARTPAHRREPALSEAAHRCTGVGACVSVQPGATMCPSYRATGRQEDSTRGRARVLQELLDGRIVTGWDAPEIAAAMENCLACKACRRECPTGVDMAALKAQTLDRRYRRRLRPRLHYTLGFLPTWLRAMRRVPGSASLANAALRLPGASGLLARAAGIEPRRMPRFRAPRPDGDATTGTGERGDAVVWVDSFTPSFSPDAVLATVRVLAAADYRVRVLRDDACCGLTWITTGQLGRARAELRRALDVLAPVARSGAVIVGIEPSCTAVWASDAADLLPDDARVADVAASVRTLAQALGGWRPPSLAGHTIVAQPHCHHAAVFGWAEDRALLERTGADVVAVTGCCGMAGSFGMEPGHGAISRRVAELELLPAVRSAGPDAILLADGFSCRTQLAELAGRDGVTLAELLASHL